MVSNIIAPLISKSWIHHCHSLPLYSYVVAGIPEEVQALCTVIAWKAPSEPNGLILSYELEFVSDQEVSTVSHQSQDLIYITTQQQRSPGTSVRVRKALSLLSFQRKTDSLHST